MGTFTLFSYENGEHIHVDADEKALSWGVTHEEDELAQDTGAIVRRINAGVALSEMMTIAGPGAVLYVRDLAGSHKLNGTLPEGMCRWLRCKVPAH
jgi:hypothetical protein